MDKETFERLQHFARFNNTGYAVTVLMREDGKMEACYRSAINSRISYIVPENKQQEFYDKARYCYFNDPPGFELETWISENCYKVVN